MDFSDFYSFIFSQFHELLKSLSVVKPSVNIIEVVILILLLWYFYRKYIKGTQSENLVRGMFVLIFMWIFSELLIKINLQIFGIFIKTLVSVVIFGLIVIFQPELRRFLGYIGQSNFFENVILNRKHFSAKKQKIDVVKELIETIKYLSKSKTGGLIVLQRTNSPVNHSDVGTKLDADVSQELLLTIFYPSTPLHDGAVIIEGEKILSAGVLLPLTEDPKLSWRYGTRHRAAIGITETSDCACIVVSEETGDVSIAIDGALKKYEDLGQLKVDLSRILGYEAEAEEQKPAIFNLDKFLSGNKPSPKK